MVLDSNGKIMIFEFKIMVAIMLYLTSIYYNFIKYFWPSGHCIFINIQLDFHGLTRDYFTKFAIFVSALFNNSIA